MIRLGLPLPLRRIEPADITQFRQIDDGRQFVHAAQRHQPCHYRHQRPLRQRPVQRVIQILDPIGGAAHVLEIFVAYLGLPFVSERQRLQPPKCASVQRLMSRGQWRPWGSTKVGSWWRAFFSCTLKSPRQRLRSRIASCSVSGPTPAVARPLSASV